MPFSEKYAIVLDQMNPDILITPFIRRHLGTQALVELQQIWQEGIELIPEEASDEEKYEIAYGNFIWQAKSNFSFIRKNMGEEGIEQFKLAEIESLKRKNASPALYLLGLVRLISPGSAFTMTAKQMAYQFQWITPSSLVELTRDTAVFEIPRCKILDYTDIEDVCLTG